MGTSLIKIFIVVVTLGALAMFGIPMYMAEQQRTELTKKFKPALLTHGRIKYKGEGKHGTLSWPKKISDLDQSELPTIPGGVFIMKQAERIPRLNNWEDRPASIDKAFFEIDDALRATSPSDIRTLVYAKRQALTDHYTPMTRGSSTMRLLTQKVVRLQFFDMEKGVYLGSWVLEGQEPPAMFRSDNPPDVAPPPPVAEFLEALPRR